MSCCAASATESFAQLALDPKFIRSHELPRPFTFTSARGQYITYRAADGSDAYGWEIKAPKPTDNYLLVIHEWWGLNDYIKQESEDLGNAIGNINVIALDMYDKKVAANREDAAKYMQSLTNERAVAIIRGAIAYAGPKARILTIGWCFGGGWSLQASLLAGTQAAGCVMYYGMPEKDIDRLRGLHSDVLGIFANKDQWITPAVVAAFAAAMQTAGKVLILKQYDADHAFANPSNPSFNKEAKDDAYSYELAFFRQRAK
jgi:carboxymethylenebutenolidase